MQIIITQPEIELAIRNHILSQIVVREGMDIEVTLAATRGSDGFTASIAIVSPEVTRPAQIVPTPVPTPVGPPAVASVPIVAVKAEPVAEVVTEAVNAPVKLFGSKAPQTPAEVRQVMEAEAEEEETSADDHVEAPVEPPKVTPQSLFKGLRKPVNG